MNTFHQNTDILENFNLELSTTCKNCSGQLYEKHLRLTEAMPISLISKPSQSSRTFPRELKSHKWIDLATLPSETLLPIYILQIDTGLNKYILIERFSTSVFCPLHFFSALMNTEIKFHSECTSKVVIVK